MSALREHLNNHLKYEKGCLKRHTRFAEYWAQKELGKDSDKASAHKARAFEAMDRHATEIKRLEECLSFLQTFTFNGPGQLIEEIYEKLDARVSSIEERLARLSEI